MCFFRDVRFSCTEAIFAAVMIPALLGLNCWYIVNQVNAVRAAERNPAISTNVMELSELPLLSFRLCGGFADVNVYTSYNVADNMTMPAYLFEGKKCITLTQEKPFTAAGAASEVVMGNGTNILSGLPTYPVSGPAVFLAEGHYLGVPPITDGITLSVVTGNGTALVSDILKLQANDHLGTLSLSVTVTVALNGTKFYRFTPVFQPLTDSSGNTWFIYILSEADVNYQATLLTEQVTYTWTQALGSISGIISLSSLIIKLFFVKTAVVRSILVCRFGVHSRMTHDPGNIAGDDIIIKGKSLNGEETYFPACRQCC